MKYIITESQRKNFVNNITDFLNFKFENSNYICEIKINEVNEESENTEGLKYDIIVYLSHNLIKVYNQHGQFGLKKGIQNKLTKILEDWFNLGENEYYIWFMYSDCD